MIAVVGLDWKGAAAREREICAQAGEDEAAFMASACALEGVRGCVLLKTCGRFEAYLDLEDGRMPDEALRSALGALMGFTTSLPDAVFLQAGTAACRRIMEIASGLQSQVLGEDQIISQVRAAIAGAREQKATTPWLETLFRLAVTAGKEVRTKVRLRAVPSSSAHKALELAQEMLGDLSGTRALVIGNGEMGQIAAGLLVKAGCSVAVTLRTYRHGSTIVPKGCTAVSYDDRARAMDGCAIVVSATKSPHVTITPETLEALDERPRLLIDLALPRDVDPACRDVEGVALLDIDDLVDERPDEDTDEMRHAEAIIAEKLDDYAEWERNRAERLGGKTSSGRVAVFAGTVEGRTLCERLSAAGFAADVYTATDYGASLVADLPGITAHAGRIDAEEMARAIAGARAVVDATHPYAAAATENIRAAAQAVGARYLRLVRPATPHTDDVIVVGSAEEAAAFLAEREGAVLLTTGSKDLDAYTALPDFAARVYARMLPDPDSLHRALSLGYPPAHLICMQGPFTRALNVAMLESSRIAWMVTKDTGDAGGFSDKLAAARDAGARVVLIARPIEHEEGLTVEEAVRELVGKPAQPAAATEHNDPTLTPDAAREEALRFPLFVDLSGARCLVVGAGEVGKRRAQALRDFGADVLVLDPAVSPELTGVRFEQRAYAPGDEEGCALAVAASNDRAVNDAVRRACKEAGVPVNVADRHEECDFFFPALCTSAHLVAGVVSSGSHHALVASAARAIRDTLKEVDA